MQPETSPSPESPAVSRRRRLRGWRLVAFPLGAVLLGLVPFVTLECVLAVFDVGSPSLQEDPLVGFSRTEPLFEPDEEDDVYRTARPRQLFFGKQEFPREKAEGTFRIFGLGGSTVRGRPYETETSFLKCLQIELAGRDSVRRYETVNCGGLSYASYRLALILDEVLQYEPDLIVLATGHNEFLEDRTYDSIKSRSPLIGWIPRRLHSLRTVTLARRLRGNPSAEAQAGDDRSVLDADVNTRLDSQSGYGSYKRDESWRRSVIEHFELSVRAMVDACRRAGVPLVLVNLGENLRDCPPFKSQHKSDLSTASLQRWQELFDQATEADDADPETALKTYRQAEAIDGEYALLIYRMARCSDRLGQTQQARRYYDRAKDLDVCPLRMLDEMHERLKRIAADANVPLLDAQELLVALSPDEIPGNNCFMDHVHPSIGAHQRIARALALKIEETGLVKGNRKWDDQQRRLAYRRHFQQLGPAYLANGRRRVDWLENWAGRQRLDAETVPKNSRGHLHLGQKRLDYGQYNLAWEQFRLALEDSPELAGTILDHALELFKDGRGHLAEEILLRLHYQPEAVALRPQIKLAYLILALDAGRTREAETLYRRYGDALQQAARAAGGWLDVVPDALDRTKAIVERESPQPEAQPAADPFNHGMVHANNALENTAPHEAQNQPSDPEPGDGRQGDMAAPPVGLAAEVRLLDEAIRRDPNDPQLYLSRARLHVARRELDAALSDSTKAVQLAPDSPAGYNIRAVVHTIRGRPEEALADLTEAIRLDPGNPVVLRLRGRTYQRMGEQAKAEADFAAAEKLAEGG